MGDEDAEPADIISSTSVANATGGAVYYVYPVCKKTFPISTNSTRHGTFKYTILFGD